MAAESAGLTRVRFRTVLCSLAALAFVTRVVYGLTVARNVPLIGDGLEYDQLGQLVAGGHGYVNWLGFYLRHTSIPIATFPPLYPFSLALLDTLGATSWASHQILGAILGAGTVLGVGLVGRRVGGERTGVLAAGIAACYPVLIVSDTSLRSESAYALFVVFAVLGAYRLRDQPTWCRAVQLGLVIGLGALTRSEAMLLLPMLVFPAVARVGHRHRLVLLGAATLAIALVISPWFVRCWITFGRPVALSTNSGTLIAGSNCDDTYHGPLLGSWSFRCSGRAGPGDEVTRAARERQAGISYALHHADRLPIVIAARIGRTWGIFRPGQDVLVESALDGHNRTAGFVSLGAYFVLLFLAVIGGWRLRRLRQPIWILLVPPALVTLISIVGYGISRFRVPADLSIVVLAAVALEGLIRTKATGLVRSPAR